MTLTTLAEQLGWTTTETSLWARAADGTPWALARDPDGNRTPSNADAMRFALARAVRSESLERLTRTEALDAARQQFEGARLIALVSKQFKSKQFKPNAPDLSLVERWLEALPVMAELFSVTLDSPRAATQLASKVKNTIGISNSIFKPGSRK